MAIDRALTWGIEPSVRAGLLREQAADWESMSHDPAQTGRRIIARQIKGVPVAIWWRWAQREITSLPAGTALALLAVAVATDGLATTAFPLEHRLVLIVIAVGLGMAALHLIQRPRRIDSAELRISFLLVGIGTAGSVMTFPTAADWVSQPDLMAPALDNIMKMSIATVGIGCAALFLATLLPRRRTFVVCGGGLVIAGTLAFAVTEIAWGVWAAPTNLLVSTVALFVAFGATLFAHMVFRLRKLEIT